MRSVIVVGVATLPTSRAALRWALRHAALGGSAVELLHVVPSMSGPGSANAATHVLAQASRAAAAIAPSVAVSSRILRGDVVGAMVSASSSGTMLVVGSSRTRPDATGLRSISRAVAARAACPVVLVRNTDRQFAFGVVVGADDSDSGRAALRFAETEAASTGQHLTIVRAWPGEVGVADPHLRVDLRSMRGSVPEVLVSSSVGAYLLVIGDARGATDTRPTLGPVAAGALDRMISPIAIVHPTGEPAGSEETRWQDAVSEGWVERAFVG